ncbi:Oxysterol-bindingc [Vanrija pseudolonga]|uniref:Oxysterol-bindingc n=1 Tax=Vanrija pseudolonga TaxID=143232 RepID=A0AAF1BKP5_9TREE|nr:Oxysterol-bindingc [Vanrija pseudolonga]
MGLLSHGMDALSLGSKSRRSSAAAQAGPEETDGRDADTSTLDKDEGNLLLALVAQLRPGMDLSKIALPTFVLEPRSLLERITDFFSHPDLIASAGSETDPKARFMHVLTFYLSGWHIKPRGVKKPYNPVLNEFFRCMYYYPDGTTAYYVAEQVSHHPPISAFFYVAPKMGVLVTGELKPKSKFLGNSAATIMEGEDRIRLLQRPEDGEYSITMPNTYARGILFGKMVLELGDMSVIRNDKTDYRCDVEFKTKGWISGGYNQIGGKVKGPGKSDQGELSGNWSGAIEFADKNGKRILFDADGAKTAPKSVLPEEEQDENESRRLWSKLTEAIKLQDMTAAQEAKSEVEEHQRGLRQLREEAGEAAPPSRFFKPVGDKFMPKLDIDNLPKDVNALEDVIRKFIFPKKAPGPSTNGSGTPSSSNFPSGPRGPGNGPPTKKSPPSTPSSYGTAASFSSGSSSGGKSPRKA